MHGNRPRRSHQGSSTSRSRSASTSPHRSLSKTPTRCSSKSAKNDKIPISAPQSRPPHHSQLPHHAPPLLSLQSDVMIIPTDPIGQQRSKNCDATRLNTIPDRGHQPQRQQRQQPPFAPLKQRSTSPSRRHLHAQPLEQQQQQQQQSPSTLSTPRHSQSPLSAQPPPQLTSQNSTTSSLPQQHLQGLIPPLNHSHRKHLPSAYTSTLTQLFNTKTTTKGNKSKIITRHKSLQNMKNKTKKPNFVQKMGQIGQNYPKTTIFSQIQQQISSKILISAAVLSTHLRGFSTFRHIPPKPSKRRLSTTARSYSYANDTLGFDMNTLRAEINSLDPVQADMYMNEAMGFFGGMSMSSFENAVKNNNKPTPKPQITKAILKPPSSSSPPSSPPSSPKIDPKPISGTGPDNDQPASSTSQHHSNHTTSTSHNTSTSPWDTFDVSLLHGLEYSDGDLNDPMFDFIPQELKNTIKIKTKQQNTSRRTHGNNKQDLDHSTNSTITNGLDGLNPNGDGSIPVELQTQTKLIELNTLLMKKLKKILQNDQDNTQILTNRSQIVRNSHGLTPIDDVEMETLAKFINDGNDDTDQDKQHHQSNLPNLTLANNITTEPSILLPKYDPTRPPTPPPQPYLNLYGELWVEDEVMPKRGSNWSEKSEIDRRFQFFATNAQNMAFFNAYTTLLTTHGPSFDPIQNPNDYDIARKALKSVLEIEYGLVLNDKLRKKVKNFKIQVNNYRQLLQHYHQHVQKYQNNNPNFIPEPVQPLVLPQIPPGVVSQFDLGSIRQEYEKKRLEQQQQLQQSNRQNPKSSNDQNDDNDLDINPNLSSAFDSPEYLTGLREMLKPTPENEEMIMSMSEYTQRYIRTIQNPQFSTMAEIWLHFDDSEIRNQVQNDPKFAPRWNAMETSNESDGTSTTTDKKLPNKPLHSSLSSMSQSVVPHHGPQWTGGIDAKKTQHEQNPEFSFATSFHNMIAMGLARGHNQLPASGFNVSIGQDGIDYGKFDENNQKHRDLAQKWLILHDLFKFGSNYDNGKGLQEFNQISNSMPLKLVQNGQRIIKKQQLQKQLSDSLDTNHSNDTLHGGTLSTSTMSPLFTADHLDPSSLPDHFSNFLAMVPTEHEMRRKLSSMLRTPYGKRDPYEFQLGIGKTPAVEDGSTMGLGTKDLEWPYRFDPFPPDFQIPHHKRRYRHNGQLVNDDEEEKQLQSLTSNSANLSNTTPDQFDKQLESLLEFKLRRMNRKYVQGLQPNDENARNFGSHLGQNTPFPQLALLDTEDYDQFEAGLDREHNGDARIVTKEDLEGSPEIVEQFNRAVDEHFRTMAKFADQADDSDNEAGSSRRDKSKPTRIYTHRDFPLYPGQYDDDKSSHKEQPNDESIPVYHQLHPSLPNFRLPPEFANAQPFDFDPLTGEIIPPGVKADLPYDAETGEIKQGFLDLWKNLTSGQKESFNSPFQPNKDRAKIKKDWLERDLGIEAEAAQERAVKQKVRLDRQFRRKQRQDAKDHLAAERLLDILEATGEIDENHPLLKRMLATDPTLAERFAYLKKRLKRGRLANDFDPDDPDSFIDGMPDKEKNQLVPKTKSFDPEDPLEGFLDRNEAEEFRQFVKQQFPYDPNNPNLNLKPGPNGEDPLGFHDLSEDTDTDELIDQAYRDRLHPDDPDTYPLLSNRTASWYANEEKHMHNYPWLTKQAQQQGVSFRPEDPSPNLYPPNTTIQNTFTKLRPHPDLLHDVGGPRGARDRVKKELELDFFDSISPKHWTKSEWEEFEDIRNNPGQTPSEIERFNEASPEGVKKRQDAWNFGIVKALKDLGIDGSVPDDQLPPQIRQYASQFQFIREELTREGNLAAARAKYEQFQRKGPTPLEENDGDEIGNDQDNGEAQKAEDEQTLASTPFSNPKSVSSKPSTRDTVRLIPKHFDIAPGEVVLSPFEQLYGKETPKTWGQFEQMRLDDQYLETKAVAEAHIKERNDLVNYLFADPEWEKRRRHPFTDLAKKGLDDEMQQKHRKNVDILIADEQARLTELIDNSYSESFRQAAGSMPWANPGLGYGPDEAIEAYAAEEERRQKAAKQKQLSRQGDDSDGENKNQVSKKGGWDLNDEFRATQFGQKKYKQDLSRPIASVNPGINRNFTVSDLVKNDFHDKENLRKAGQEINENDSNENRNGSLIPKVKKSEAQHRAEFQEKLLAISDRRSILPGFDYDAHDEWKFATWSHLTPVIPNLDHQGKQIYNQPDDPNLPYVYEKDPVGGLLPSLSEHSSEMEQVLEMNEEEFTSKGVAIATNYFDRVEQNLQIQEMRDTIKEAQDNILRLHVDHPDPLEYDRGLPEKFVMSLPQLHFNRLRQWAFENKQPNSVLDMPLEQLTSDDIDHESHEDDYIPFLTEHLHPNDPSLGVDVPGIQLNSRGELVWAKTGQLYDQSKMDEFHLHNLNYDPKKSEAMAQKIRDHQANLAAKNRSGVGMIGDGSGAPTETTTDGIQIGSALHQFSQNAINLGSNQNNKDDDDGVIQLGDGSPTSSSTALIVNSSPTDQFSPHQPGEFDHLNPANYKTNEYGQLTYNGKPIETVKRPEKTTVNPYNPNAQSPEEQGPPVYLNFKYPRLRPPDEKERYKDRKYISTWLKTEFDSLQPSQQKELMAWYDDYIKVTLPYTSADLPRERRFMQPTPAQKEEEMAIFHLRQHHYDRNAARAEKHRRLDLEKWRRENGIQSPEESSPSYSKDQKNGNTLSRRNATVRFKQDPNDPVVDPRTHPHLVQSPLETFVPLSAQHNPYNLTPLQQFITTPAHLFPTSRVLEPTLEEIRGMGTPFGPLAQFGLDEPGPGNWQDMLSPQQKQWYTDLVADGHQADKELRNLSRDRRQKRAEELSQFLESREKTRIKKRKKDANRRARRAVKVKSGKYDEENDPDFDPTEPDELSQELPPDHPLLQNSTSESELEQDSDTFESRVRQRHLADIERRKMYKTLANQPFSDTEQEPTEGGSEWERRNNTLDIESGKLGVYIPDSALISSDDAETHIEDDYGKTFENFNPTDFNPADFLTRIDREIDNEGNLKPEYQEYERKRQQWDADRLANERHIEAQFQRGETGRHPSQVAVSKFQNLTPGEFNPADVLNDVFNPKFLAPHEQRDKLIDPETYFDPNPPTIKQLLEMEDDLIRLKGLQERYPNIPVEQHLKRLGELSDKKRQKNQRKNRDEDYNLPINQRILQMSAPEIARNQHHVARLEQMRRIEGKKVAEQDFFARLPPKERENYLLLPPPQRDELVDNFSKQRRRFTEDQLLHLQSEYQRELRKKSDRLDQIKLSKLLEEIEEAETALQYGDNPNPSVKFPDDRLKKWIGFTDADGNNNNNDDDEDSSNDYDGSDNGGNDSPQTPSPPSQSTPTPPPAPIDPDQPIILSDGPPPSSSSSTRAPPPQQQPSFTMIMDPPPAPETEPQFKATWRPAPPKDQI